MLKYNENAINEVANIAAISQESAAGTQEAAAIALQQNVATQNVTRQADALSDVSYELKQLAAEFKYH